METQKKGRKAQVEIVGLLIIVILITVIILLVIVFGVRDSQLPKTTQQVKDSQLATLMFPTMLETTTSADCARSVRELLGDCAYGNEIVCGGKDSCTYANETIATILKDTLDVYGYAYNVTVYTPQKKILVSIGTGGCNSNKMSIQKSSPFPTQFDYQTVIWSMRICQGKK